MRSKSWAVLASIFVLLFTSERFAQGQVNSGSYFGYSTAGGSGGTPTGPTNPGALGFGTSTGAGPGGLPTGPLNPNVYGYGASTAAGSGGLATGPTAPNLGPIPPDLRIMAAPSGAGGGYVRRAKAAPVARSTSAHRRVYRNR
jgi:hypothetical protein